MSEETKILLRKICIDLCVICEDNEVMEEEIMNYFDNLLEEEIK